VYGTFFVKVKFRDKSVVEFERILIDTSASFTVMPLDIAEKYFIETPFTVDLKLDDGRVIEARVFIAEGEIKGGVH
jgi:predicted aspartyl protease